MANEMPAKTFTLRGFSLATLGLEGAQIQHADGKREPLEGFIAREGLAVAESLESILPPGASLITHPEPAERP